MVNPCKNKLLALHLQSISFGEKRIATLAQLVEQRIRNAQVEGSNPLSGSKKIRRKFFRLIFFVMWRIFEDRFFILPLSQSSHPCHTTRRTAPA